MLVAAQVHVILEEKKSFNRNRCSSGWYYDAVNETELSRRSAKDYRIQSSSRLEI